MAKVTVTGNAFVITSAMKLEDIKTIEKYRSNKLFLYEDDEEGGKELVFRITTSDDGGSVSQYGIVFSEVTHDGSGAACYTGFMPSNTEDAIEYVTDKVGLAVMRLNKLEDTLDAVLLEIAKEKAAMVANITMM